MAFTDDAITGARHDSDDISLVLRQILRRSSTSMPPPLPPQVSEMEAHGEGEDHQLPCFSSLQVPTSMYQHIRISDGALNDVVLSSSTRFSNSLNGINREFGEECDFGNEEAVEEQETWKQHSLRNQSKRSRAAEVHNLSEKRRRSKINEKMKALQNLIPNSNKTDKASMLDEAIEYLKQLQLQVQMLSIRNGLSLHALCLPEILSSAQLSQFGRDFHRDETFDVNVTNTLNATPNVSDTILSLPKQCASSEIHTLANVSAIINSEAASFGLESCALTNFNSFELHDQAVRRDQKVHQDHHNMNNTEINAQVTTVPPLFDIQESNVAARSPLEEQTSRKCGPQVQEMRLGNVTVGNQLTSNISGLFAATSSAHNTKLVRR